MNVRMQRAYRQPSAGQDQEDTTYWAGRKVLAVFDQPILSPDVLESLAEQLKAQRHAYGHQFDVKMDVLIGGNFVISRKLDREGK